MTVSSLLELFPAYLHLHFTRRRLKHVCFLSAVNLHGCRLLTPTTTTSTSEQEGGGGGLEGEMINVFGSDGEKSRAEQAELARLCAAGEEER